MRLISAPRLVISGSGGDSGKTLATLGLINAWRREGTPVQPFKKGPDYIDPAWLTRAAGRQTRNLDSFLMGRNTVLRSFSAHVIGNGVNLIEGNRGLHDGEDATGSHSTAVLARILRAPLVIMLPVVKVTRTAAAFVLGMKLLDPDVELAGVILNQVAGPRHERLIRQAIEEITGIPVLGAIPKITDIPLTGRHLGLVTPEEHEFADEAIDRSGDIVRQYVDIQRLREIAFACPAFETEEPEDRQTSLPKMERHVRIGVFTGPAFTFYYPENLEALRSAGAELLFIDPLIDRDIPQIDALYIGGGFPETHCRELTRNEELKAQIRRASKSGLPIWAECGGLMFLARSILWKGDRYEMANVFPIDIEIGKKPVGHGYSTIVCEKSNPFFPVGSRIKGHEFHYSKITQGQSLETVFHVERGVGVGDKRDGILIDRTMALYTHIHAEATPGWAEGMVNAAEDYHKNYSIH